MGVSAMETIRTYLILAVTLLSYIWLAIFTIPIGCEQTNQSRTKIAKRTEDKISMISMAAEKEFIIDPNTHIRYTRTGTLAGKNDVITNTTYPNVAKDSCVQLSPNGKFILYEKLVVPLDGSEPFDLVDTSATRCTWAPDGTKVAFYSGDAICVVSVSSETGRPTGPIRKLIEGNYKFQMKASWSPDGEKLVFQRTRDLNKGISGGDIWTLSIKDGLLTQITSSPNGEGAPAWSPDGKTIVYGTREGNLISFRLVPANGGISRRIIELEGPCLPIVSPDSKWILYKSEGKIHFFGLNSGREFEIIPPEEVGDFFSWSPDGKKMLFYRPSYGDTYDLKVVSASGGQPIDPGRLVTLHPWAVWSLDSERFATKGQTSESEIAIWIVSLSGEDPVPLQMDISVDGNPFPFYVSPNNKTLAFSVDRFDGTEDMFVVPISFKEAMTTGAAVKVFGGLQRGLGRNVTFSWSPDSHKIAVIHRGDVWIAFSNGDKPVQITKTSEMEVSPGWSPDGTMINYISKRESGVYYIRPVSVGEEKQILGADSTSAWSPDSKKLVIQSEGLISTVSVADGETRQIANLNDLGLERIFCFSWSPDGKYIACVGKHREKGDSGPIFIIPVERGEATVLATNDTTCKYWISWSPDGKWIAYDSEGFDKVRTEGTICEADFEEILKTLSERFRF
jgi:Tol biopolymer transport system component